MLDKQSYETIEAVNYSTLSKLSRHPRLLIAPRAAPTAGQRMGSLIDCLMLTPEEFDTKFFVSTAKLPAEAMENLLNEYLRLVGDQYYPINEDALKTANDVIRLGGKWKFDTVLEKFKDACTTLLSEKLEAGTKLVVDRQTTDTASFLATRAKTNEFISNVMSPITPDGLSLNQLAIVWNYDIAGISILCKSLLDNTVLHIVDGFAKKVTINDVKWTSGDYGQFLQDMLEWNYPLQTAMYTLAIGSLISEDSDCSADIKKYITPETEIEFNFVVITRDYEPLIYPAGQSVLDLGVNGGYLFNGVKKKGVLQLMQEYIRHKETGYYDYPWDIFDNQGKVDLHVNYFPMSKL